MTRYNRPVMNKILVPVDFSLASLNAVRYAAHLAAGFGSKLTLLHVFNNQETIAAPSPEMRRAIVNQQRIIVQANFATIVQNIPEETRKKIVLDFRMAVGPVQEEILFASDRIQPNLVVMGMRGNNSFAEKILGSTTTAIVKRSNFPVMIVPAHARFSPIRQIAFATNFEDDDLVAIDQLLKFASRFSAKVHCIHIRQNGNAQDLFKQEIMKKAFEHDVVMHKIDFDNLSYLKVVEGLNHHVREYGIDILVMLTHQRGIFSQLFQQGQVRNIALQAAVPLWAFQIGVLGRANAYLD